MIRILFACLLVTASLSAGDAAVATVNGEAISAGQLAKAIPPGVFGATRTYVQQTRLKQLIELVALRQRLTALGAEPDPAAVDRAFAEKTATPPAMGCGCCVYRSYDDYLAQIFMTRDDARLGVWIDLAIDLHAARTWEQAHPGADGAAAAVHGDGLAVRARSRLAWNLGFDCEPSDDPFHPKPGTAAWQRAGAAMARLRAGESFEQVAGSIPGEQTTVHRDLRGEATPIETLTGLGVTAEQLARHPAGMVDEPVANISRWQIVRWAPLSDAQVLAELRARHAEQMRRDIADAALNHAVVRYVGAGVALAPPAGR